MKAKLQTQVPGFEYDPNKSISYSSLKHFKKSPLEWVNYIRTPYIETEAMLVGKLVDEMVFNPDTFTERYFKFLNGDGRTKAGKEMLENAKAEAGERKLIKFEMWQQAEAMAVAIMNNTDARKILDQVTEVHPKYYWDDQTGLRCSVELDGLGENIIVELKTDKDARPEFFGKSAINNDYPLQCAFCWAGLGQCKPKHFVTDFYYLVVEKEPPYNVAVYLADEDYIAYGLFEMRKYLDEFKLCADTNSFHMSYEFRQTLGYNLLTIPGWAKQKMEI